MGCQPRDPSCFEEWLFERRKRQDEVGRVAGWVISRMKPEHPARWTPEPILLERHGHACDVPLRYERYLRHVANLSEDSTETFFRVYDLYLKDESATYDRMVQERGRELGAEFVEGSRGGSGGDDDGGTSMGADEPEGGSGASYSWESWNRFFYELHGREGLGTTSMRTAGP